MAGGRGEAQSKTWLESFERIWGGRERVVGERFLERISEASGRSVRVTCLRWGKEDARVMPTIPQPAPSSRTLRFGLCKACSRIGSFGVLGEGLKGGDEREARYEEKTRPASLEIVS